MRGQTVSEQKCPLTLPDLQVQSAQFIRFAAYFYEVDYVSFRLSNR